MRLHAFIDGQVQGVGFRWNTQQQADRMQITGWVRNLDDGRVEIVADSEKEEMLTRFLAWLRHGPRGAAVANLDYEFSDADEEFDHFSIVG